MQKKLLKITKKDQKSLFLGVLWIYTKLRGRVGFKNKAFVIKNMHHKKGDAYYIKFNY